ncbi:MAG TPA: hypothetical protein VJO33_01970 [Gemmatimonadaceae bacterium]|nr:hypothetical protein [Gemmatimonadaceae bacterium]
MTREQQFATISAAKAHVLQWAESRHVPLVHVDVVVPFVETDFSLSVWLFYDTDASVSACSLSGTTAAVQAEYRAGLSAAGYDLGLLPQVEFYMGLTRERGPALRG